MNDRIKVYEDDKIEVTITDPKNYDDSIPMYPRIFMGMAVLPKIEQDEDIDYWRPMTEEELRERHLILHHATEEEIMEDFDPRTTKMLPLIGVKR